MYHNIQTNEMDCEGVGQWGQLRKIDFLGFNCVKLQMQPENLVLSKELSGRHTLSKAARSLTN